MRTSLVTASVVLAAACGGAPPGEQNASAPLGPDASVGDRTITGGQAYHGFLPYRARDAKLALVQPSFVEASEAHLVRWRLVVGVTADGLFRAYPLYVLKNHQVVNDRLGDVPLAASW